MYGSQFHSDVNHMKIKLCEDYTVRPIYVETLARGCVPEMGHRPRKCFSVPELFASDYTNVDFCIASSRD